MRIGKIFCMKNLTLGWLQQFSKQSLKIINGFIIATIIVNGPLAAVARAAQNPTIRMESFRLDTGSQAFVVNGQQQGSGDFANGSGKDYPEGACIPFEIEIKNGDTVSNIDLAPSFDFLSGSGITDLQVISTNLSGNPALSATNLADFTYTTTSFSAITSVTGSTGPVAISVTGPLAGASGVDPNITATDNTRHYNIAISGLPANEEAYIIFCARLSNDAKSAPGASVSVRAGGSGGNENTGINPSGLIAAAPDTTITVTKTVINDDGGTKLLVSDFPLFINGVPVTSGDPVVVSPGTFVISETNDPAEYAATFSGGCDQNGVVTIVPDDGNINTIESKTCNLTNDDIAIVPPPPTEQIVLTATLINNDGGTATLPNFQFFLDTVATPDFTSTDLNTSESQNFTVAAGSHDFDVNSFPGYTFSFSNGCDANGELTVVAGTTATCTITIDDIAVGPTTATLTIVNQVINDETPAGTATTDNFQIFLDGGLQTNPLTGGLTATYNQLVLAPGTYSVTETVLAGYDLTFADACDNLGNVTLTAGDNLICTVINNDLPVTPSGTITVIKTVINTDGGTAVAADFPIRIEDGNGNVLAGPFPGSATGTTVSLPLDTTYEVIETQQPGYGLTGQTASCSGTITALNPNIICTLTNDDVAPGQTTTLTVVKNVINDNTGVLTTTNFQLFLDGNPITNPGTNTLVVTHVIDVTPGNHTVSETPSINYAGNFSGDCDANGDVFVPPGSQLICVLTNNDLASGQAGTGDLGITLNIINDDGGTATSANFQQFLQGVPFVSPDPVGSTVVTNFTVFPGTYLVQANTALSGYNLTFSADCDATGNVTVVDGGTSNCVITADDIAPVLTVIKRVVNDTGLGGNFTPANFSRFLDSAPITGAITNGLEATSVITTTIGSHTVSETQLFGYFATFSGDCDASGVVDLAIGDNKTCIITNDDFARGQAGSGQLTIIENIINDDGGLATSANFQQFLDGLPFASPDPVGLSVSTTFIVSAAAHQVTANLGVFTNYTITLGGACDTSGNISVPDGGSATCIITINDIPVRGGGGGGNPTTATLTVSVVVINHGGNLAAGDVSPTVIGNAGNTPSPDTFPGSTTGTIVTFNASGSFTTTIAGVPSTYSKIFTGCAAPIALGDNQTCVITLEEITTVTGGSGGSSGGGATGGSTTPPPTTDNGNGGGTVLGATDDATGAGGGATDTTTPGQVLGATDSDPATDLPRTGTGFPVIILSLLLGLAAVKSRQNA